MVSLKRQGVITEEAIRVAFEELADGIRSREDIPDDLLTPILQSLILRRDYEVLKFREDQLSTKEFNKHKHPRQYRR